MDIIVSLSYSNELFFFLGGIVWDFGKCIVTVITTFANNTDLMAASDAYDASESWTYAGTDGGDVKTSTYTWGKNEMKAYKDQCTKDTTNMWIDVPDYDLSCTYEGQEATVMQSNYGTCLPDNDACNSMITDVSGQGAFGNYSLYEAMSEKGIDCTGLGNSAGAASSMTLGVVALAAATVGSFLIAF